MIWKKATATLPSENEEVLIREGSEYHLAKFDSNKNAFILRDGTTRPPSDKILWTKLIAP